MALSGTEYGTVMGYGSIRYRIRYGHGIWLYPVQNTVRSQGLDLSGTEYGTIMESGTIWLRILYDRLVWIRLVQSVYRGIPLYAR